MNKKEKSPSNTRPGGDTSKPTLDSTGRKQEGKYVDLPGAKMRQVVVRFPPEASGYLHIGHAKAALLNQYYQLAFEGKLVLRFDDTNPEKEKEDYEEVIREDVRLLKIQANEDWTDDGPVYKKKGEDWTYTSDQFKLYYDCCTKLINEGKAYVDNTPADQMKIERDNRENSKNRDNSVEVNLKMWQAMVDGTEDGLKCCVRAKIDMSSNNGCMRDPTLYRCKKQPHPRTKSAYNIYPTYDFACPIIDSFEGITHTLRTSEYMDRDVQYYWVCDALGIRKPHIHAYSRLNLQNTVLSKRKLTWFVDNKIVDGWDDPRMPTVRGVLRRGMTVEGLKQFIIAQGSSRAVVVMEWDKLWSFNKKVIDPLAPRYAAVEANSVKVTIADNIESGSVEVSVHPKNTELGKRQVQVGQTLLVDQLDAQQMKVGENVTFVNWGNLSIQQVLKQGDMVTEIKAKLNLEDKNFKKTYKSTWIERSGAQKAVFVYFDNLISKPILGKEENFQDFIFTKSKFELEMLVEADIAKLQRGTIIQVLRKGFFIVDEPATDSSPIRLISIPDGSTDVNIFPQVVQEWKANNQKEYLKQEKEAQANRPKPTVNQESVSADIKSIGDKIRKLKEEKAAKSVIMENVQTLNDLKKQFKEITGCDWQPSSAPPPSVKPTGSDSIDASIRSVGDKIRKLKEDKAEKSIIMANVSVLNDLKKQYKEITGTDWQPSAAAPLSNASSTSASKDVENLTNEINKQGDKIRELKASKASKEVLTPEINTLLSLKADYRKQTGKDFEAAPTQSQPRQSSKKSEKKENKENVASSKAKPTNKNQKKVDDSAPKKQTRLGMEVKKSENFADWYTEVITKAEMIEYYDVSGCYILRPWAYSIWESIQSFFDAKIKELGVSNCYFPMFVTAAALEKEKAHIADFAPEVAWVTKSGDSDMAEPIAIRPTSETVMYPSFAKWIQSYRDLPIKLNQWCNVVRWEFKNPTPFLRTREFLWQEGHTAHASEKDAKEEVHQILDFYSQVYEHLLGVPVIKGKKTEKEKFPGGEFTTTIEGYIAANGRGIQAATSHHLGQNFSKMFEIVFEDPEKPGEKRYAYQNSWGLSTRSIGTMIMVHSDDKGLVLPPRVASTQAILTPCGVTASTTPEEKQTLFNECESLVRELVAGGIRCKSDTRDNVSPGWKYNHWELKGVPIRIELGPKDIQKQQFVAVRRDNGVKLTISNNRKVDDVKALLEDIQNTLYNTAKKSMDENVVIALTWSEFISNLEQKKLLLSPFCGQVECEENIKKDSAREDPQEETSGPLMGAKSLCIPFEQPKEITTDMKCIHESCNVKPQFFTLFGRSY